MKFHPALAALSMTLAVAACGDLPFGQSEPETPAHSGPPTVSPLDQPIQTSDEGRAISTAEAATMNTALFRASGNGGAWAVTAGNDMAVLERAGQRSVGVPVRRITYAQGVEFIGQMNGRTFTVNIRAQECTEAGSRQKQPFTARVSAAGQRLEGCAGPTDTMPTAQVRASTGAPAAARRATPAPAPAPAPAAASQETPAEAEAETPDTASETPQATPQTPAPVTTPSSPTPEATPEATPQDDGDQAPAAPALPRTTPSEDAPGQEAPATTTGTGSAAPTGGSASDTAPSTGTNGAGTTSDTGTGTGTTGGADNGATGSNPILPLPGDTGGDEEDE